MDGDKTEEEEPEEEGQHGKEVQPEGNNNQPGELKEKLLALSLGNLPPLLPLDCEEVEPKEQLASVGKSIAQLTSTIATVASPGNLQELTVLQASLLSLQQQQLRQFRLLSTLQQQEGGEVKDLAEKLGIQNPFLSQMLEKQDENDDRGGEGSEEPADSPPSQALRRPGLEIFPHSASQITPSPFQKSFEASSKAVLEPVAAKSEANDSLSSVIITNHEPMQERPVNTLELLQQKSASILQSASMGILANNLADLSATPYPGSNNTNQDERSIKHKCRYCGKVFGSESALSIHIRSHTGERPYKCNICGNRFTTKGNLKVHFSRHSDRFPNIKMNPNMVLEHLDKFYPALLQQCEEAEKKGLPMPDINNPMAGMTPVVPPGMTLPPNLPGLTPPLSPTPRPAKKAPLPPTTPKMPLTMGALPRYPSLPTVPIKREDIFKDRPSWLKGFPLLERPPLEKSFDTDRKPVEVGFPIKHEIKTELPFGRPPAIELLLPKYPLPQFRIESLSPRSLETPSENNKGTTSLPDEDNECDQKMSEGSSDDGSLIMQDEPENLSNGKRDTEEEESRESLLSKFQKEIGLHSFASDQQDRRESPLTPIDPTKDPNIYNVLLPRPGSTDNSWESLIEVDKSNEAPKLESLVSNLADPKQNDPNECVLCHRILSCKSALQMHYRVHTGERPFKCKICNRTFTTKGNLKTHMGVHRSKPPMRSFPQCPVCHKKYANSVVLQQHIKTHTGEKTEMSLEQISAAEIRDFHPGDGPNIPFGLPTIRPPGDPLNKFLPQFPILSSPRAAYEEDLCEEKLSRPSSVSSSTSIGSNLTSTGPLAFPPYSSSFSASLAALEKQVRTMDSQGKSEEKPTLFNQGSFSRDLSPDTSCEEPQDLSRTTELRADSRGSGIHEVEEEQEEENEKEVREERDQDDQEEDQRQGNNSRSSGEGGASPLPHQHRIDLMGARPPLPLPFPPLAGFPHHLFPGGLPPLPFPMPGLSPLPAPPPGFPHLGIAFPAVRRKTLSLHPISLEYSHPPSW